MIKGTKKLSPRKSESLKTSINVNYFESIINFAIIECVYFIYIEFIIISFICRCYL